jgi:hypothetical protein
MLNKDPFKYVLAIMPRRSGKDLCALNICLKFCLREMCNVFYVFPTFSQGRKVIWDSISSDGKRLIEYYFPDEVVKSRNSTELKITFKNGSIMQIVGSTDYDKLRGTNPRLIIYSEAAYQDENAFSVMRPVLAANNGQALFITTPQGKNWFYELYQIAKDSPEWFVYRLTIDETHHISEEQMELEKKQTSYDKIQEEYYCSFELGVRGAYYARYLQKMNLEGRIGQVPYEINHKVHCCFDLGMADSTCIIWFQVIGSTIKIIDCYENHGQGLEHYAAVLQNKPYVMGRYIAPHDIQVRELGTGMSRLEKARQLGIPFIVAPNLSIVDGIEAVRTSFARMWIDDRKCEPLIRALENYRQEYDQQKKVYKNTPNHDWSSHFADAMRYLCISLPKTHDQRTPEEWEQLKKEYYYGDASIPSVFDDRINQKHW